MTPTSYFCLLPWYNPFNDHMTQYDLDVTSICLVFWVNFMRIIYETSFWKLDHRVDTTETSMMKPTFQVEVSRNSRHWIPPRRPSKNRGVEVDFWVKYDLQKRSRLKLPIPTLQWNDLGDFSSIYKSCFFEKTMFPIFLHQYFVKGFLFFPHLFTIVLAWQVTRLRCSKCLAPVAGRIGKRFIALPLSSLGSSDMGYRIRLRYCKLREDGFFWYDFICFFCMFFICSIYVFLYDFCILSVSYVDKPEKINSFCMTIPGWWL